MFARMAWLEFREKRAEEGFKVLRDKILPTVKERKGCRGVLLLRDLNTGNATLVTLWEAKADMVLDPAEDYPAQTPELQELLAGPAPREFYEVAELSVGDLA